MTIAGDIIGGLNELADDLAAGRAVRATVFCKGFIMERAVGPNRTGRMPKEPLPPVMSPTALRALVKAAGLDDESPAKVAKRVGFSRIQWWRLLNGKTNINERSARLIRSKLKPKKS